MRLDGRRLLVPVTAGRREMAARLAGLGAVVDEVEFIAVVPPVDEAALSAATAAWCDGDYDWMAVTSRNAVVALAGHALDGGRSLAESQPRSRVATVGEATRAVCASVGLTVSLIPSARHDARGIADAFPSGEGRVLVPVGDLASPALARGIGRKGWTVDSVQAYRVVDGPGVTPDIAAHLAGGAYDAVLLTSGSVAERYAPHGAGPETLVVAIGRTTAAAARAAGLNVGAIAAVPSYDGILDALRGAWNDNASKEER